MKVTELQNSINVLSKRVKELEEKALKIEMLANDRDEMLGRNITELDDSLKAITSQTDDVRKEMQRLIKSLISTVSNIHDLAAGTDLERLNTSTEDFKPESWLTARELERLVELKINERLAKTQDKPAPQQASQQISEEKTTKKK